MTTTSLLDLIGNTPIIKLKSFDTGPCELYMKLELMNPTGSIKDRIALKMVEDAEEKGHLKPGGTIIEATAGNTGLALALVATTKGYQLTLVIPDKMSHEKIDHLRAAGANIILTRSDVTKGHPEYYQDMAQRIADETENAFYINQFGNEANPRAHEATTGPEIWQQMDGQLDALVLGVGTSGTLTGVGRYLKKQSDAIEIVVADPVGSILTDYINKGELIEKSASWLVEGIGEDYIPSIADMSVATSAISVTDTESFQMARALNVKEGIFAGSSTGTLLAAALKYCQGQTKPKKVLTFACDSGNKYLSKMYNDNWLTKNNITLAPQ